MDRNERSRRHKQNIDVHSERRNAQQRNKRQQQSAGVHPAPAPRPASAHRDHAPVFDQDHGRKPAPQQAAASRKKQVTKKELRRRARRRRMLAVALAFAAVVAGAVFGVSVLFQVNSISVQNPEGYVWQGSVNSVDLVQPETPTPEPTAQPTAEPEGDSSAPESNAQPTPVPTTTPEPAVTVDTGPYTQLQITSSLGVQLGDNLFSFNLDAREQQMELALPLLEEIEIQRKYPSGIIIVVTPAVATWCTPVEGGWLVLSESFKVMEFVTEQPQLPNLLLCDAKRTQPGTHLATNSYDRLLAQAEADAQQQAQSTGKDAEPVDPATIQDANRVALDTLVAALAEAGILDKVTAIDTSNPEEIAFVYEGRICVLLGTANQMDYKMDWATTILLNVNGKGCSSTDRGELDISHIRTDGTIQPVFRQGDYELPGQAVLEPEDPATDPETDPNADPAA